MRVARGRPVRRRVASAVALRARLSDAERTLQAIRRGHVDALLVAGPDGDRVVPLDRSSESFRIFLEGMSDGAARLAEDGTVLFCNARLAEMLGASPPALVGRPVSAWVSPRSHGAVEALLAQATSRSVSSEWWLAPPGGRELRVCVEASAYLDDGRSVICVVASATPDRRRARVELERMRALYHTLLAVDGLIVRSSDARQLLQGTCRILIERAGLRAVWAAIEDEGTGVPRLVAAAGEGVDPAAGAALPAAPSRTPSRQSVTIAHGACRGVMIVDAGPKPIDSDTRRLLEEVAREVGFALDAFEAARARSAAERALRASERKYRLFFEQDLAGHYVATPQGSVLACNAEAARIFGLTDGASAAGLELRDVLEGRAAFEERLLRDGRVGRQSGRVRRADGSALDVVESAVLVRDASGRPLEVHGFLLDDSERQRAEASLRQAQKMEAVGRLAGGMAHDFNNLLGVILGYAEVLGEQLPAGGGTARKVEAIRGAAQRGARLTRQVLGFSRKQVLQPRRTDVNHLVVDALPLLRPLLGEAIEVRTRLPEGLPGVLVDVDQIQQCLLNLAANARDAMPDGGEFAIETRSVPAEEAGRLGLGDLPHVEIAVRDTGAGMNAETLAHVFEPFFTTKEPGKGVGLGLASVYGVIRQSGGNVSVKSALGQGTAFLIHVPATEQPVTVDVEPHRAEPPAEGGGRLLLVEDDSALRQATAEILEGAGFSVLAAAGPGEARELLSSHPAPIDALVTDVVMPGTNGRELAREFQERHPAAGVLYISGYSRGVLEDKGVLEPDLHLVLKPFSTRDLVQAVRRVLAAGSRPALPKIEPRGPD